MFLLNGHGRVAKGDSPNQGEEHRYPWLESKAPFIRLVARRAWAPLVGGYCLGAFTGAAFIGGPFLPALVAAPLGYFMAYGEYLWPQVAGIATGVAVAQLIAMALIGLRTERPILLHIGIFVASAILAFIGGATASGIASL